MTLEQELGFADQVGRHYARQYGMPPMMGRVAGWLEGRGYELERLA